MSSERFGGTVPLGRRAPFDVERLERYLRAHLDEFEGRLTIEQFRGGQSNPTFLIRLDDRPRLVLRKKPAGALLPSAHAVDREYRVMSALGEAGVPVPRMRHLCEDPGVIGTVFFVMDFVGGRSFWDPGLSGMEPAERARVYDEMNRVMAAIHALDPGAVGLADFGRSGNYFERQIARWSKQYRASETEPIPAMDRLIEWLPAHVPADDPTTLVHGDYRLDNLIFHPTQPRVLAVLDWELSTLGSPVADFAYHVMGWRMPVGELGGLRGLDLSALGIPDEPAYVASYCRRTGRDAIDPQLWEYAMAYNLFRIACIRQGIRKRVLDGTATSAHAAEVGARARSTAEQAWQLVEERLLA